MEASHVESLMFWRARRPDLLVAARARGEHELCPICQNGWPHLQLNALDVPWQGQTVILLDCPCESVRFERKMGTLLRRVDHGPGGEPKTFEQIKFPERYPLTNAPIDWAPMRGAIAALTELAAHPWDARWVFLHGQYGNGKTHLLQATRARLPDLAAYVYVEELGQQIFSSWGIDRQNNTNLLSTLIADLSAAPVLLLDDLGTEYAGSPFVVSTIGNLIHRRYMQANALPTVISTNLLDTELLAIYPRVHSRLRDSALVSRFLFNLPDYRPLTGGEPPAAAKSSPPNAKGFSGGVP